MATVLLILSGCSEAPGKRKPDSPVSGWTTEGIRVVSAPAGDGSTVAVVDGSAPDLEVRVFDASSGEERFSSPWSPSRHFTGMGVGSPAVIDDVVIIVEPAAFRDTLVGLNGKTGERLWEQTGIETFAPIPCGPHVCTEEGPEVTPVLVARDPLTGTERWRSEGSQTTVVNEEGLMVLMRLGAPVLISLDPATGTQKWSIDLSQIFGSGASTSYGWDANLVEGVVVAAAPGYSKEGVPGGAVGVNPATGAVIWDRPDQSVCPLHVDDMAVLCGLESGLRRVNPATGEDLWVVDRFAYPEGGGPFMGITADLSHLLAHDGQGNPIAIDVTTGEVIPPDPKALGWMIVAEEVLARTSTASEPASYIALLDPVPWNTSEGKPAEVNKASEVPAFVGATLPNTRVFVDGNGNARGLSLAG